MLSRRRLRAGATAQGRQSVKKYEPHFAGQLEADLLGIAVTQMEPAPFSSLERGSSLIDCGVAADEELIPFADYSPIRIEAQDSNPRIKAFACAASLRGLHVRGLFRVPTSQDGPRDATAWRLRAGAS